MQLLQWKSAVGGRKETFGEIGKELLKMRCGKTCNNEGQKEVKESKIEARKEKSESKATRRGKIGIKEKKNLRKKEYKMEKRKRKGREKRK